MKAKQIKCRSVQFTCIFLVVWLNKCRYYIFTSFENLVSLDKVSHMFIQCLSLQITRQASLALNQVGHPLEKSYLA